MVHFDLIVIYDIEKFFGSKITPYVRYTDEIQLIYDDQLPMPAMSFLNKETGLPSIVANDKLIPADLSIQSHILSHEMGHIINKDIYVDPTTLDKVQLYKVECLADEVAAEYIQLNKERYPIKPILDFLMDTCFMEQQHLHDELTKTTNDINNSSNFKNLYYTDNLFDLEKKIDHIKFRIHNYKDDVVNRMNILQNIIL
jgi:hypothetical protein